MLWMVCRVSEEALRLNQAAGRFVTIAGDGGLSTSLRGSLS